MIGFGRNLKKFCVRGGGVVIVLFFVVTNLGWIAGDTRPWPVIDCYMGANNVMAAMGRDASLHVDSPRKLLTTLSQGGRPPLYQLCTIPFIALLGNSEDAFLAVNLVLFLLLFAGIYRLGLEVQGHFAGLIGGVAVACFPPIVHILRQYRPYLGAFACIGLTLWALMVLINRQEVKAAWASAIGVTAAILMHPLSVWILLVPMASTWLWVFFRSQDSDRLSGRDSLTEYLRERVHTRVFLKGLLPAATVPLVFVLGWYLTLGRSNYLSFREYNSSWLSAFRGGGRLALGFPSVPADFRWLALTSPHAISLPLAVLTLVLAAWLLFKGDGKARLLVLWLAGAYLVVGVFAFALSWQYGAFALPLVAAVLGVGVAFLPTGKTRVIVGAAVVLSSVLSYSIVTWGLPRLPRNVASVTGLVRAHCQLLLCPDPPVAVHLPIVAILAPAATRRGSNGRERTSLFTMSPGLSSEAYRFVWLRLWPGKPVRMVNHGSQIWGSPFPFEGFLQSGWLIVRTGLGRRYCGKGEPNLYLRALARFFQKPPRVFRESYAETKRSPWPGGGDLVLYRRVRPVSIEEIDAVVGALDLDPPFLTTSALMAAKVLAREGREDEALQRLERAAEVDKQPPRTRARILARAAVLALGRGETR